MDRSCLRQREQWCHGRSATELAAKLITLACAGTALLAGTAPALATPVPPAVLAQVAPRSGAAKTGDALIDAGRLLFATETFGGNGRTCSTCHRPDHNYTIDPAYIARLPASDPLFVAETDPALAGLERPQVLRKAGLVAVNIDGLDKPPVYRAVPQLLSLSQSMRPEPGKLTPPGGSRDLKAALGWSGDGAPGTGTLREFIVGAILQHLPRTLSRVAGKDFRVPGADELDALEAFLLSLGRREELDIARMRFTQASVEQGRVLFQSTASGPCASCHANAGGLTPEGFNGLRDIGIEQRTDTPARHLDPTLPGDGGFGVSPATTAAGRGAFGDNRFDTPSLIEAADTAPLFHDNSAPSIEQAVLYYTSPTFAASPEGKARARIFLRRPQVASIAAFLRTLNAMENIRGSNAELNDAQGQDLATGKQLIALASNDTKDAVSVLSGGAGLYRKSVKLLGQALTLERQAAAAATAPARNALLQRAIGLKAQARGLMVR